MIHAVKMFLANMKLQHKLMLCFSCVTAFLFLFMGVCIRQEYSYRSITDEQEKVQTVMHQASDAIDRNHSLLVRNTSRLLLDESVFNALDDLQSGKSIQYAQHYQELNERLSDYVFQMEMIDSVCLFYNDFSYGSQYGEWSNNPYGVMDRFEPTDKAFNFYPLEYTPQTRQADVFPIAIQLQFKKGTTGNVLTYGGHIAGEPTIVLWVFVKQKYIDDLIQIQATTATDRFYLVDEAGEYLTEPYSRFIRQPYSEKLMAFIRQMPEGINQSFATQNDTYYVSKQESSIPGLYLIHLFAKSTVEDQNTMIYSVLSITWIIGVLVFSAMTLFVTLFLTKPFERLRLIIQQINEGRYDHPQLFKYRDEVGMLGTQINQMYETIQEQIQHIKQEESQKAKAEIQMYSEQINPHFLYNTLECIHFQILNEHTETASKMIESLGQYLRITLSHGQLMIPLQKEIDHVTQYMNIINSHSEEAKILFSCNCPDASLQQPVLKLILQPLTENAVKHGFSKDWHNYMLPPEIQIDIVVRDGFLVYEVVDNGKGIDIQKAQVCMQSGYAENSTHFGLQNIYQRLHSTYGPRAAVEFESIPYFRNVVRVKIPLETNHQAEPAIR